MSNWMVQLERKRMRSCRKGVGPVDDANLEVGLYSKHTKLFRRLIGTLDLSRIVGVGGTWKLVSKG